ncbi:hypothetical protein PM082_004150 [Marasmius tenuissimus]|nr:hypothetical protein PM082_004150 [Marasmius tenuissimus]
MEAQTSDLALDYTSQLPPEVLIEIFSFCPREDSTFDPCSTLWILGQVCSRWRQVSADIPAIWTTICVDMEELVKNLEIPATSILSTTLERTKGHPLDIRLVFHPEFEQAQRLFDLLRTESGRWATFKFRLPKDSYMSFSASTVARLSLHPSPSSSFAALREADAIRLCDFPGGLELLTAFAQSPSLRKLVLFNVKYVGSVFAQIPWHQLTQFEVHRLEWAVGEWAFRWNYPKDFSTGVLSKSPNLGEFGTLHYSWTRNLSLDQHSNTRNSLSSLVELDLHEWYPEPERVAGLDISSLYLPSLQYLTLRNLTSNDLDPIMEMIERSSCRLLSASLFHTNLLDLTVKRFLFVSRESLRKVVLLQGRNIGSPLLECFFSHSSRTDRYLCFPRLEELEIDQLMLVDLEPYDRVLGLEIPFGMSRFHRQLRIHVVSPKNSTNLLSILGPSETELLQELGRALCHGHIRVERGAFGIIIENMPVVDCILTYLEKYHGSSKSVIRHATRKVSELIVASQRYLGMTGVHS